MCYLYLPPANEVWGKVMFLQVSAILFTGGAWSRRGVPGPGGWGPGPRGAWSQGGCLVREGSGPSMPCSFPGPYPRGKFRGIWPGGVPRPTSKGEVEGDLVQAHPPSSP